MALDDTTLLKRWTTRRDAEAFDEIVGRFADPVYGTCWRILRNDADAEEITQECFLHLVRSAGEIRSSLGGWLHQVATTKSLDRIRREIHRRERERVYEEGADVAIEMAWDDIQEHVDAAIDTLPDDTRDVIVAHFLQRKTHAAIAAEQAVSRRAISYRIERGLEAIRRELRRRGASVTTAALGTSLATEVSAAPLSLKATLGKLAIAVGTNSGAVGATTTSSLLGSLVLMKLKVAFASLTLFVVLAAAFIVSTRAKESVGSPTPDRDRNTPTQNDRAAPPDTTLDASIPSPASLAEEAADERPPLEQLLALSRAELERALEAYPSIVDPQQYTMVSGVVRDQDGYPIDNATVQITPADKWGRHPGLLPMIRTTTTASDGTYHIEGIDHGGRYWIGASKPGYADSARGDTESKSILIEGGTHSEGVNFNLESGPSLAGRIVNAAGIPVSDGVAFLYCITGQGNVTMDHRFAARSDSRGNFRIGLEEKYRGSHGTIRVQSKAHGNGSFVGIPIGDGDPVELRLAGVSVVRGRVTSNDGPVPGARVTFVGERRDSDGRNPAFTGAFTAVSDGAGHYAVEVDSGRGFSVRVRADSVESAGKEKQLTALSPGETRNFDLSMDTDVITIEYQVTGVPSGNPIDHGLFIQIIKGGDVPGIINHTLGKDRQLILPGVAGEYTFQAQYGYNKRVAGPVSKSYNLVAGDHASVALTLPDPQYFSVHVTDSSGAPLPGVNIHFMTTEIGSFETNFRTNEDGRLDAPVVMPPEIGARMWLEKPGYATSWGPELVDQRPGTIHLEETIVLYPGAGFEGDLVDDDGLPIADTALAISVTNNNGQVWPLDVRTDANGHFTVVEQAPAEMVTITLSASDGGGAWSAEHVPLEANAITSLGEIVLN